MIFLRASRVLESLLLNAYHATDEGYILITCEDISGDGQVAQGFDALTPSVRIRIKDSGRGMSEAFCQSGELFKPFSKEDQFSVSTVSGVIA
jgi:signal transduction histidine kinase